MLETHANRYSTPVAWSGSMPLGYGGGFKKRIFRYVLAAFLLAAFILFCNFGKQEHEHRLSTSSSLELSSDHHRGRFPLRTSQEGRIERRPHQISGPATHDVSSPAFQPVVGKITISFGEPDEVYERAIKSHELHNEKMGYPQFVLRERVLSGLWSKHAYIISVLVQELAKPEDQRLRWLMFVLPSRHTIDLLTRFAGGLTAIQSS
jgi:hypothetical protein